MPKIAKNCAIKDSSILRSLLYHLYKRVITISFEETSGFNSTYENIRMKVIWLNVLYGKVKRRRAKKSSKSRSKKNIYMYVKCLRFKLK